MMQVVFVLVLVIGTLFPTVRPRWQQPDACPAPLFETDGFVGYTTLTSGGDVLYTVEKTDAGGNAYQELYSLSLDGSAPTLVYDNRANGRLALGIVTVAPDGSVVALLPNEAEALVIPVAGGEPVARFMLDEGKAFVYVPHFSADGRFLRMMVRNADDWISLYQMPLPDGSPELITDRIAMPRLLQHYSESFIAVGRTDQGTPALFLQSWHPPYGTINLSGDLDVSRLLETHIPLIFALAGDYVLFEGSSDDGVNTLYSASVHGGTPVALHSAPPGHTMEGVVSLDERTLAFEQNGKLYSVPVDGSTPAVYIADIDAAPYLQPNSRFVLFIGQAEDVAGTLFRVPVEGGTPIPYAFDQRFSKNFRVRQVGDTLLIQDSPPNEQSYVLYGLPVGSDGPLRVLFDSVWDITYGEFYLVADWSGTIVFRRYDGISSSIYRADVGESFDPVPIGCTLSGHVRLVGIGEGQVVFLANDRALYAAPLTPVE